ncbi:MAG: hypothetical protein BWZ10_02492 [candidate division BRC1 bacterium ADurb.BinA364]|nr:MAG: hypothetical protein BWZ10_02492 [candidate division BRC1 bacterium ADurb.BinA364]
MVSIKNSSTLYVEGGLYRLSAYAASGLTSSAASTASAQ